MYAILTGRKYAECICRRHALAHHRSHSVYPFYELKDVDIVKSMVQNGKTGYIDPRYLERSDIEARLAEIVQRCWEHDIDERPDIFQVRKMLRQQLDASGLPNRLRSSPLLISRSNSTLIGTS